MFAYRAVVTVIATIAGWTAVGQAQTVTIQQPVVRQFSVGTTVSVPDRGTMFLGRIGRAADNSSRFGPLPSGRATGSTREHAGANVGVFIHDLRAMDEELLSRANRTTTGGRSRLQGYAAHAYDSLMARQRDRRLRETGRSVRVMRARTRR